MEELLNAFEANSLVEGSQLSSNLHSTSDKHYVIVANYCTEQISNNLWQFNLALGCKFQELAIDMNKEREPYFLVKQFEGDKKERAEEAISTWFGRWESNLVN